MLNLKGIDVDGVNRELEQFVAKTRPINASRGNVVSARSNPECGRAEAIKLVERIMPILDRLYPDWADENETNAYFEFQAERDACSRLLARIASDAEIEKLIEGHDAAPQLAASKLHELVWQSASAQWTTGHRHEAVLAACKAANSRLQEKLDRRDLSEVKLVQEAFSDKAPERDRPRLRFAAIDDVQTRESMRKGAMSFGVGCFQAIRNPVGHLPNNENDLDEQSALERLAALSLFLKWVDEAEIESAS